MKQNFFKYLIVPVLGVVISACSGYVQSVEPLIDVIQDNALDVQAQVPFLNQGVQREMARCYSQTAVLASALSDETIFDVRVPNATFPQFQELDNGLPQLDNNSVNNNWTVMGSARFTADNLLERVGRIKFTSDAAGETARKSALYTAYLCGGIVRYLYAAYYGLSEKTGGGVINGGPFIPSSAMTDSALTYLNKALENASTDLQRRQINTLIAKVNLIDGRYAAARTAAQLGLRRGDAAYSALYDDASAVNSRWHFDAGRGRSQLVPDPRFAGYIRADSLEGRFVAATVSGGAYSIPGTNNAASEPSLAALAATRRLTLFGPFTSQGLTFHVQAIFPNASSPIPVVTWQENELMLAETALRSGNADAALTNVNNVRAGYGLSPRTVTNLDSVYIERDKSLFGMGTRLCDQRRFNKWHLNATTWQHLPIGLPERSTNKNLQSR